MSSERSWVMCFGWRCTKYTPALFQLFVTSHDLKNTKVRSGSRKRSWTSRQSCCQGISTSFRWISTKRKWSSTVSVSLTTYSGQHRSNHSHCTLILSSKTSGLLHTHTLSHTHNTHTFHRADITCSDDNDDIITQNHWAVQYPMKDLTMLSSCEYSIQVSVCMYSLFHFYYKVHL